MGRGQVLLLILLQISENVIEIKYKAGSTSTYLTAT